MFKFYLLAHVLGDFYFQSTALAKAKEDKAMAVFIHSLLYGFVFVVFGAITANPLPFLILASLHALIDFSGYFIRKSMKRYKEFGQTYVFKSKFLSKIFLINKVGLKIKQTDMDKRMFLLDQLFHVASILWVLVNIPVTLILQAQEFMGIDLNIILSFLLIYKPANIFVQIFSKKYNISKRDEQLNLVLDPLQVRSVAGAGRFIGYLERSIILLALMTHDVSIIISGIAMVLSAKTISRYGKTRDDEHFAEYFVIGTMLSILFTIMVAILLQQSIFYYH